MEVGAAIGLKVLENLTDDIYKYTKEKTKLRLKLREIKKKIPILHTRINSFRIIKTLWQVDKPVDIESFYCDSHVLIPEKKGDQFKRKKIDIISDLSSKGNFVIKGIAGQGKSIFLRHLFIREIEKAQRIPVFIELRRIQNGDTLLGHISQFLDILNIGFNLKTFKSLVESGKFIFFFDAYDEIQEHLRLKILNEIENLASNSLNTQFIISTRPNTDIEMSPLFSVVTLDNLQKKEYEIVIDRLSDDVDFADSLKSAIKSHKANISDLLITPLLVTLLIISYKSYQTLPEQMSDFYDSIFLILLKRHDGTKPGFIRVRRCHLNDTQYREIFDALCFQAKKYSEPYHYRTVYEMVDSAMSITGDTDDPECYLDDIKKVTCLLLEEGDSYRFIHRSVNEYYAASFVKNLEELNSKRFYSACIPKETYLLWEQEIRFLSEIDRYRYLKYYYVPLIKSLFNIEKSFNPVTKDASTIVDKMYTALDHIIIFIGKDQLLRVSGMGFNDERFFSFLYNVFYEKQRLTDVLFRLDLSLYEKQLYKLKQTPNAIDRIHILVSHGLDFSKNRSINLYLLYKNGMFKELFAEITKNLSEYVHKELLDSHTYIRSKESHNIINDVIKKIE